MIAAPTNHVTANAESTTAAYTHAHAHTSSSSPSPSAPASLRPPPLDSADGSSSPARKWRRLDSTSGGATNGNPAHADDSSPHPSVSTPSIWQSIATANRVAGSVDSDRVSLIPDLAGCVIEAEMAPKPKTAKQIEQEASAVRRHETLAGHRT